MALTPFQLAATAAVGSAVSAAGAIQAGRDQKQAHEYNAQIADRNAEAERINAERVEFLETARVEKFRREYADFADAQRMAFAANNVSAATGTPLLLALQSEREAETEIRNNLYNIKLGKQAREEAALNQELEGRLQRMYGRRAQSAATMQAGQSLLSGASNIFRIQQGY